MGKLRGFRIGMRKWVVEESDGHSNLQDMIVVVRSLDMTIQSRNISDLAPRT